MFCFVLALGFWGTFLLLAVMLLYIEMSSQDGIVRFLNDLYSICLDSLCSEVDGVALPLH